MLRLVLSCKTPLGHVMGPLWKVGCLRNEKKNSVINWREGSFLQVTGMQRTGLGVVRSPDTPTVT